MNVAPLSKIKKELELYYPSVLQQLLVRLMKYKKENKELINYLIYMADDEPQFLKEIKLEMDAEFAEIKKSHWFAAKKRIQKTVRTNSKYIRFSADERTETEIRLYFCKKMRELPQTLLKQRVIAAIFIRQLDYLRKSISQLHEDLQYDYNAELEKIMK